MIDEDAYAELESQLDECYGEINSLECRVVDLEYQLDDMYSENQSLSDELDAQYEVNNYEGLSDALLDFYRATKEGRSTYSAEIEVQAQLSAMDILV